MRARLFRGVALFAAMSLMVPLPSFGQAAQQSAAAEATAYNVEQLDALLAPIALYPDTLLVQVLMASTYPLQVVEASRWLAQGSNKDLQGDALANALEKQNWDPSVKSLLPFPQVLAMLSDQLEWTEQIGYAFAVQQSDVMDSVQRLRRQAQAAGFLKTNEQQSVVVAEDTIAVQPANPQVVYVPAYNPTVVYGTWPYPTYPPAYYPPPSGYVPGSALAAGIAFGVGVATVASLWGWASPTWGHGGYGSVNVNVNRYNNLNVNRPPIQSPAWRPPAAGVGGRPVRPPAAGPVGRPTRPTQLPANAVGRPNVTVPGGAVNRPPAGGGLQGGPAQRPGGGGPQGGNVQRPGGAQGGTAQRPGGGGAQGGNAQRPGGGGVQGGNAQRPAAGAATRPTPGAPQRAGGGAFGGVNDGTRAGQYGNRGAQSRNTQKAAPRGGGAATQQRAPAARAGGSGARGGGGGGRVGGRG